MYGYLKVDKLELKYKEYSIYRKYYCAVCNSLRENLSKKWCLLTSYDATLFLLLFDGISKDKSEFNLICPLNPFNKGHHICISADAMQYTAFISLFYYYSKLKDNILDEKSKKYQRKFKRLLNNQKCKQLFLSNEQTYIHLNILLSEYFEMEKNDNYSFDDFSNKMGEIFGFAFSEFSQNSYLSKDENKFYKIGYDLGKWIYIADAFDDLEEDIKLGQFNPILHMTDYSTLDNETLSNKILFISKCITQNIYYNIEKLCISENINIINNIVIHGMNNTILSIIKNKYRGAEYDAKNNNR